VTFFDRTSRASLIGGDRRSISAASSIARLRLAHDEGAIDSREFEVQACRSDLWSHERIGDCVERREPLGEFLAEVMACGDLGRRIVRDLGARHVRPNQQFER
jgi:hypothetical protein